MKTDQAIKIVEGMRHLEQANLQQIENYQEPHRGDYHYHDKVQADAAYRRKLANHKILVGNARDRVDALDIALRALMHFQS